MDGMEIQRIARWNGQAWTQVGAGLSSEVKSLCVFDMDGHYPGLARLFAAGHLTSSGDTALNHFTRWNGAAWEEIETPIPLSGLSEIQVLKVLDHVAAGFGSPSLIAGGWFRFDPRHESNGVGVWNGNEWSAMGSADGPYVYAKDFVSFDDDGEGGRPPRVLAGGYLDEQNYVSYSVGTWNGEDWVSLGKGIKSEVTSLISFDSDGEGPQAAELYAGGNFSGAGGVVSPGVARWNGYEWRPISLGMHAINAMCKFSEPAVFAHDCLAVAGYRRIEGGEYSSEVAALRDQSWIRLSSQGEAAEFVFDGEIRCLAGVQGDGRALSPGLTPEGHSQLSTARRAPGLPTGPVRHGPTSVREFPATITLPSPRWWSGTRMRVIPVARVSSSPAILKQQAGFRRAASRAGMVIAGRGWETWSVGTRVR